MRESRFGEMEDWMSSGVITGETWHLQVPGRNLALIP
jgi:hypothetical protein